MKWNLRPLAVGILAGGLLVSQTQSQQEALTTKIISSSSPEANGVRAIVEDVLAQYKLTTAPAAGKDGAIGMTWKGVWSKTASYAKTDAVFYNGSAYFAVNTPAVGNVPGVSNNWSLLASKGSDGVNGAAGATGAAGAAGAAGAVGMTWKGAWSNTATYAKSDVVFYAGSAYYASAVPALGDVPGTATTWSLLASKGADGLNGKDGKDGINGKDGAAGKDGLVGMTWKGAWSNTDKYAKSDVVFFTGSAFFASNTPLVGDVPGVASTWTVLASKGLDGANGKDGATGANGANGKDGVNGADGKDGVNGVDGKDGAVGTPGLNGKDGKDGLDGKDGINGVDGKDGAVGTPGLNGKDGIDGVNGVDGANGKDGVDGKDGAVGPTGAQGAQGLQGLQGAQGPAGPAGPAGQGLNVLYAVGLDVNYASTPTNNIQVPDMKLTVPASNTGHLVYLTTQIGYWTATKSLRFNAQLDGNYITEGEMTQPLNSENKSFFTLGDMPIYVPGDGKTHDITVGFHSGDGAASAIYHRWAVAKIY